MATARPCWANQATNELIEHPEVDQWLDKYCAKAPFHMIYIAADTLVIELE
jgi:hypothetical protein